MANAFTSFEHRPLASLMKPVGALPSAVVQTHNALFQTWFPLERLDIPPRIKPEIAAIADKVSQEMLAEFSESAVLQILEGLTAPQNLPFYGCLKTSKIPRFRRFSLHQVDTELFLPKPASPS